MNESQIGPVIWRPCYIVHMTDTCWWLRPVNAIDNIWLLFSPQHDNEEVGIFPQHTKDVQSPQAQGSEAYNRRTQATVEKLTLNKRSIRIALHLGGYF